MKKEHPRPYRFFSLLLLLIISGNMYAQTITVTGTVTDKTKFPLPGVAVAVKGTTTGTITDVNGVFSLVVPKDAILFFSFLGMKPQEVPVKGRTTIDVQLEDAAQEIEEVQVVSYGVQKKVTVTGAISSIKTEDLVKNPTSSISHSLSGKLSGITTTQYSGQPGSDDASIKIRGTGTYNDASPLFIVDGVERPFTQLDPREIEDVTVLKDASATAVYGIRGANGVIIVTTKRGKEGKANISASFSLGIQQPTKLLEFADSYTFALRYNETEMNDGIPPDQVRFQPHVIEELETGDNPLIYPSTDWVDYILKKSALQKQGSISASGGTDKVKYFVMVGIFSQDGLFNTFDTDYDYNFSFTRWNYRSNIDIKITNTTQLGLTLGGRVGINNEPNADGGTGNIFPNIYRSVPFAGPGVVDGKWIKTNDVYIPGVKKEGLSTFYGKGYINDMDNSNNLDLDLKQDLRMLTQGLNMRFKFAYNTSYSHYKTRSSSKAYYEPFYKAHVDPESDLYNQFHIIPKDKTVALRRRGEDGVLNYSEGSGKSRNMYFDISFNYSRKFNDHEVTGLLLYNQRKLYYPSSYPEIPTGLVGLVGRVTYNYKTKYMAEVNLGYNGSENFAPENRFGLFPAGSIGWILTQEKFLKDKKFLNYLKIRMSSGLVGNDRYGGARFMYLEGTYNLNSGGYNFGVDNPNFMTTATEQTLGNPHVSWETALKSDIGFDAYFLNSRLKIVADYFLENRKDILTHRQTIPSILTLSLMPYNLGKTRNEGYEFSANWRESLNKLTYWVNANVSYSRNKIIFQDEVPKPYEYMMYTGKPIGTLHGYLFDGFFTQEIIDSGDYPIHPQIVHPGDVKHIDVNGDGYIHDTDKVPIGHTTSPEYVYGVTVGLEFKGFNFSMFWQGAARVSRLLYDVFRYAFGTAHTDGLPQYIADGRWTPETAATAKYPRLTFTNEFTNSRDGELWYRNASYIRLKNMEIGYTFHGKTLKKLMVGNLRVYANGYNLLTFDQLKIQDPEANIDYYTSYPLLKVYNFGIQVDF
jgi:TonB-linked SusC/RagA family outer membrane protein